MSGHSKWSTIKHKKGAADAKRGQLFTKLTREITVAAREGAPDPVMNFRLRLAVDNAKSQNMPKDNIERAIAKGSGKGADGNALEELVYEAYGPGGTGFIIQTLTDNRNRAASGIRSKITRGGGNLAANGSVSWNFEQKGLVTSKSKAQILKRSPSRSWTSEPKTSKSKTNSSASPSPSTSSPKPRPSLKPSTTSGSNPPN